MAGYRLSRRADGDLTLVYLNSFQNFGEVQADTYASELISCFRLLAEQPRMGSTRRGQPEDKRIFLHRGHVIAYRITAAGILIQRVLDSRSDWQRIFRRN